MAIKEPPDRAAATWLRFKVQEITLPVMISALEIKAIYHLCYWDAAIVAAARAIGWRELLSEDMSHGREVEGVIINDHFAEQISRAAVQACACISTSG